MTTRWKSPLTAAAGAIFGALAILSLVWWNPDWIPRNKSQAPQGFMDQRMDRMAEEQEQMLKRFRSSFEDDFFAQGKSGASLIDAMFGSEQGFQVSQREDDSFLYYDVRVDTNGEYSVKADAKDGYLVITGEVKKNADSGGGIHVQESSFQRVLPLDPRAADKKLEVITEADKVVLKFPKK